MLLHQGGEGTLLIDAGAEALHQDAHGPATPKA